MWFLKVSDVTGNGENFMNKWENFCQNCTDVVRENIWIILESPHDILNASNTWDDKEWDFTILDIPKIKFESESCVKDFLRDHLKIDLDKKSWLEKFNNIYSQVVSFYEYRYLRKLPKSLTDKKFENVKQIFKFLQSAWQWRLWVYHCELAKFFFIISFSSNDIVLNNIDDIHDEVVNKIKWQIDVLDQDADYSTWFFYTWDSYLLMKLFSRSKSIDSIYWKMISSPSYWSIENIHDLSGITLEVDYNSSSEVVSLLHQYFKSWLFLDWTIEIENKKILSEVDLISANESWIMDIEYIDLINKAIHNWSNDKWKWTPKNYEDVRIKWKVLVNNPRWWLSRPIKIWVEIKIVKKWNKNEHWLQLHAIYDYKKRLRELTRSWWYIRLKDIINFINDFFSNLNWILNYKRKDYSDYLLELFLDLKNEWSISEDYNMSLLDENFLNVLAKWLFKNFLKDLVPVKKNKWRKAYFVHKDYVKKSDLWILSPLEQLKPEKVWLKT